MNSKLSKEQINHLKERLRVLRAHKIINNPEDPPHIKKARVVIERYENKTYYKLEKKREKISKEIREANEALYFSTPEKALMLIKKLEAKYSGDA